MSIKRLPFKALTWCLARLATGCRSAKVKTQIYLVTQFTLSPLCKTSFLHQDFCEWGESCSVVSNPLQLYSAWNSPGQSTGVGSSSQPRNWTHVSHITRWILYQLSHQGTTPLRVSFFPSSPRNSAFSSRRVPPNVTRLLFCLCKVRCCWGAWGGGAERLGLGARVWELGAGGLELGLGVGKLGTGARSWGLGAGGKELPSLQPSGLPGSWFPGSLTLARAWRWGPSFSLLVGTVFTPQAESPPCWPSILSSWLQLHLFLWGSLCRVVRTWVSVFTLPHLHLPQAGGRTWAPENVSALAGNTALPLASRQLPRSVVSGAALAN